MQICSNSVLASTSGAGRVMAAHVRATRLVGKGAIQLWQRQVYVKMASTALLFSALQQPVRPVLALPARQQQQQVRPVVRVVNRGNHSSSLLLRQCSSTDISQGASRTVLLETRECADGSIMYKFGSPDQIYPVNTLAEEGEEQSEAQLTTEASVEEVDITQGPELSREPSVEPVVVVNGVPHTSSSAAAVDQTVPDVDQKLANLDFGKTAIDSASSNGISIREEATAKDLDSPESGEIGGEIKDEADKQESPTHFNSGAAMIPHPDKAARGGEDAYFIEGTRWIGVADGVGGWANDGINAGLYARELMSNCAELVRQAEKDSDPKTVLVKSFSKTKALGSTTAVVASITNETVNVVNIGDSGFLVIRDGICVDRSKPMLRGFNFPYQIGSEGDDPLLAEVYTIPVFKGDVIVFATDGVFDNLFEFEIIAIVKADLDLGSGPEVVAQKLAGYAHEAGAMKAGLTPFAKEAHRAGYTYGGGKMDDITVVVSFVS